MDDQWNGIDVGAAVRAHLAEQEAHYRLRCRYCLAPPSALDFYMPENEHEAYRLCRRCGEAQQ